MRLYNVLERSQQGSWASFLSTYYLLSPIAEPIKVTNVFPSNHFQGNNSFLSSSAYLLGKHSFSPLFAIRCSNGMYSRMVWQIPKVEYEGRTCTNNKMAAAKAPVPLKSLRRQAASRTKRLSCRGARTSSILSECLAA